MKSPGRTPFSLQMLAKKKEHTEPEKQRKTIMKIGRQYSSTPLKRGRTRRATEGKGGWDTQEFHQESGKKHFTEGKIRCRENHIHKLKEKKKNFVDGFSRKKRRRYEEQIDGWLHCHVSRGC